MANEYLVPLGVDANNLMQGLNETLSVLDEVDGKAADTGKTIEEAFGKGAKAADNLDNSLAPAVKSLDQVRAAGQQMGKELADVFAMKGTGREFEQAIGKFKKQLSDLSKNKINIDVNDQKLVALDAMLTKTTGSVDDMNEALAEARNLLNQLDPNSAEFQAFAEAIEYTETVFDTFNNQVEQAIQGNRVLDATFEEVYGDLQPLTTRLGELEDRMYEMALAGQSNTEEFKALQREAIRYRQTIQQVDAAVDTFAKRSAVLDIAVEAAQGLTGAFAAVQGAAALFGEENEEVAAALLKVNAAMSVLQGVQAVAAVLNKESAISALLFRNNLIGQAQAADTAAASMTKNTIATRVFGVAFKAIGIGLIVSLIAALAANWDKVTEAINKVLPAGQKLESWFDRVKSVVVGVGNVLLQYFLTPLRVIQAVIEGDFEAVKDALVKSVSFKQNFMNGFNAQELANEKKHLRELEEARIEADARDLVRRKNRGEDVTQAEIALQKRRLALQEEGTKEYTEELHNLEDMEDRHFKTMSDKRKQAADEAAKQADENRKKRIEAEQKANAQILEYARALEDARITAIRDAGARERAEIAAQYDRRIEDLKKQQPLTTEAEKQQTDLIVTLIEERDRRIAEAEREAAQNRINIRLQALQTLHELEEESMTQELALLQIDHDQRMNEINEQYKDEEDLRKMLVAALEQSTQRERSRIQKEWGEKLLKEEEERQILAIETASQYAKRSERVERQKQIAILETKVEFAKKYLDALVASGAAENSVEVLQAKKTIQDLQNELQDAITDNKGKGFDFFEFIGLGDLTGKERDAVKAAGKQIADSIGQITDFIVEQYDRQIEKRQEVIDSLGEEIDELEDKLDEQRSLQEAGYASDVALVEAELAEKKKQQDEEIKMQEELQKKKEAIQKAQMAADTAMQLVNMITASTNIFNALSGIPFIGIPLAIATIGVMFGAFIAAKIKAGQAIQQGSKQYGGGGWIDGKPHTQGGKKYYSDSGDVRELEADEFVVRKKVAKKYGNLLEAMNGGKLSAFDINDYGLREMLRELGITFLDESAKNGLDDANDLEQLRQTIIVKTGGNERELREMNENIRYLAQKERERITSWEDEKYIYKKQGNRVTRILKPEFSKDGKDS